MGTLATPSCSGPVAYSDRSKLEADIANLKDSAVLSAQPLTPAFQGEARRHGRRSQSGERVSLGGLGLTRVCDLFEVGATAVSR